MSKNINDMNALIKIRATVGVNALRNFILIISQM